MLNKESFNKFDFLFSNVPLYPYSFVFSVCLPIFAYGTAMGWISPNKAILMSEDSPSGSPLSEEDVSWMASIMFIFAPIAVFVFGMAADKFGRKNALLFASVPISVRNKYV